MFSFEVWVQELANIYLVKTFLGDLWPLNFQILIPSSVPLLYVSVGT